MCHFETDYLVKGNDMHYSTMKGGLALHANIQHYMQAELSVEK